MKFKKIVTIISGLFFLFIIGILGLDYWISYKTSSYIYYDSKKLPYRSIGLVLGTSKYISKGGINPYYKNRIDGAIQLYTQNKVDFLLLSGDNTFQSYNEPKMMELDLIKAKIPNDSIFLDHSGFRTLDSVIRAYQIFNVDDFTIITQDFHCERAIFIAMSSSIKAQCFAVPNPEKFSIIRIREMFARVAAFIDVYILKKEPKDLGEEEPIITDEENTSKSN